MINMNTISPVMIFIIGAIICLDNIKVLFRYYVYGIEGSMVPFIGGVLLMTGVCLLLNKNLNYKMAILLFDITFICWPLAIMRNIILWLIKKGAVESALLGHADAQASRSFNLVCVALLSRANSSPIKMPLSHSFTGLYAIKKAAK